MKIKNKKNIGMILTFLSACLYAFNVIIEKKYVRFESCNKILFLMYLGAGIGLYLIHKLSSKSSNKSQKLTKKFKC